jgi:regulator of sirC expression with transglutaminase-like and TPR domain
MMNRLLGVLLAQKQDYAGAAQNMRDYLHYAPQATDTEEVKKQLADVEKRAEPEAKKQ